jgi:hypothetical protein
MFIFLFLLILVITLFIFRHKKENSLEPPSEFVYSPSSSSKRMIRGRFNLKCNETLVKPFMIRNRCKKYVNNDGHWEFIPIENDKYNILFNDVNLCTDENGACFYKEHEQEEKTGCKNVCSANKIFDLDNSDNISKYFYVENKDENSVVIKTIENKYLCLRNNKLIVSDDECTLQLLPL